MSAFQQVLSAARALNTAEQILLASTLWDDIPPTEWPLPDARWIAEAQRRSDEFDQGRMPAAPWSEVQARARRKAGLDD